MCKCVKYFSNFNTSAPFVLTTVWLEEIDCQNHGYLTDCLHCSQSLNVELELPLSFTPSPNAR